MIKLFEHPLSPYAQKVKLALIEKGIPFEVAMPDIMSGGDAAFRAANPRLEVPALVDDGETVFDSTIILEYLEDKWPTPPHAAGDPDRARASPHARGDLRHAIRGDQLGSLRDPRLRPREGRRSPTR